MKTKQINTARAAEDDDEDKKNGADAAEEGDAPETEEASAPDLSGCANTCTAAAEALRASADAFESQAKSLSSGVDSISEIGATREAWMVADKAGDDADKALAGLAGEAPAVDADDAAPAVAPPAPDARAVAAVAGASAAAQAEVTAQLAAMRRMMASAGAKSVAALELKFAAGMAALGDVAKFRAAEQKRAATEKAAQAKAAEAAKVARLEAAVQAGMPRAQAFKVGPKGELTPKAAWMAVDLKTLDSQLVELGYAAEAPPARATLIHASPDGGGEAGLAARAAASGMSIEDRRAAEARINACVAQENSR